LPILDPAAVEEVAVECAVLSNHVLGVSVDENLLARQVNERIREIAEIFASVVGDDAQIDFVCECGCLTVTPLTLEARAALEGQPLIAPGHPLAAPQP
jgi:hypothetical protein